MNKNLQIAILGASGIGKFHARNFNNLGQNVCAILGSSATSSIETSNILHKEYGIEAEPFYELSSLLKKSKLDAISICTPTPLHHSQLIEILDNNIPIFCEKPLFWDTNLSLQQFQKQLDQILSYKNRAIYVNTSNATLIEALSPSLDPSNTINRFNFKFHTNGNAQYFDIAIDLLPHAISMLIELIGIEEISSVQEKVNIDNYQCHFQYGGCTVNFSLSENKSSPQKLQFKIEEKEYIRIQKRDSHNYKIYLKDIGSGDIQEISDPLFIYISRFLEFCSLPVNKRKDAFNVDAHNLELMAKILLKN